MAFNMTTQAYVHGAVNQGARTQTVNMARTVFWNAGDTSKTWQDYGTTNPPQHNMLDQKIRGHPPNNRNNSYDQPNIPCDVTHYYRAFGEGWQGSFKAAEDYGAVASFKTHAINPTIGTPSLSGEAAHSVVVDGNWTPATDETTVTIYVQYKKNVDSTWSTWGSSSGVGTGYGSRAITQTTVTGLDPDTLYNFRLYVNRAGTTNSVIDYYGSVASTATLPDIPEATTLAATNVNAGEYGVSDDGNATLNGEVDRNDKTDAYWRFVYDTDSGTPYSYSTSWVATTTEPETVQEVITGLTESQIYYFRLEVQYNEGAEVVYGSELNFTVPDDPLAEAAEEDHMPTLYFDRKYKVEDAITFCVRDVASSSSDRLLTTASPFVSGDVKISKDGGAFANTTNLPVQVTGSQPGRSLTLTDAELTCAEAHVVIRDQDGPAFRDLDIIVRTEHLLGSVIVDADQYTNKTAVQYIGKGTGHGLDAAGGATGMDIKGALGYHVLRRCTAQAGGAAEVTLDTGASGTNDFFNDAIAMLVSGDGAGQSRVIIGYVGSTKVATVDASWVVNPSAGTEVVIISGSRWNFTALPELSALPADGGPAGQKIQFGYQRFAFKIDQTATLQQLYESDNSSILASRSVADAAGTQTVGKLS